MIDVTGRGTAAVDGRNGSDGAAPVYSYRPGLVGAGWEFRLQADGLAWQVGSASGIVRYQDIRRVRLSYRPVTQQHHRFLTEVWSSSGPKLRIFSTTWRGMTDLARQDIAYRMFVTELHRRIAAAGTQAIFETGVSAVVYGLGLVVFAVATLAFAAMTVRALQQGQWSAAAIVAGLFALLGWQLFGHFRRNRPRTYRPDAIPEQVLPRG